MTDCFGEHFFTTNFWFVWCSTQNLVLGTNGSVADDSGPRLAHHRTAGTSPGARTRGCSGTDRPGNHTGKPVTECSGWEILDEILQPSLSTAGT
ncbi:hypothetical protein ACIHCQ_18995 [Streptomyces sp. NPDC052236]|uniref:hypothetical protein n=1 Tax=Streptomyces sp. NPDC052236 TaxID=3365686 RepID=UPI0037D42A07